MRTRTVSLHEVSERDLLRHVRAIAEVLGWRVFHCWNSLHSPAGMPDLILCRPPRLIFMELKSDKGKVTAAQQAWLDDLAQIPGIETMVVRPLFWYAGQVEELLR